MKEAEPPREPFDKKAFEDQWNEAKKLRRLDNLAHADQIYVHGTFFIHGVGQPKQVVDNKERT